MSQTFVEPPPPQGPYAYRRRRSLSISSSLLPAEYFRVLYARSFSADQINMEARLLARLAKDPPSEDEVARYFFRLSPGTKLIARTGPAWPKVTNDWSLRKFLCPFPLGHAFVAKWNPVGSALKASVIQQLKLNNIDWVAIDAVGKHQLDETYESSVPTLLITVPADSTKWDAGNRAVTACKIILEDHGIKDMEVEMKTGEVNKMAFDCPQHIEECGDKKILLATSTGLLGLPIGPQSFFRRGTLGIHLSLLDGDGKKVARLALTCRHCLFKEEDTDEHLHERDETVIAEFPDPQEVNEAIEKATKTVKKQSDEVTSIMTRLTGMFGEDIPEGKLTRYRQEMSHLSAEQKIEAKLKSLQEDEARFCELGHVLYSPPIEMAPSSPLTSPWRPDWALIRIGDHRTEIEAEENWCYVGSRSTVWQKLGMAAEFAGITVPEDDSGKISATTSTKPYVELTSVVIPEEELFQLPSQQAASEPDTTEKRLLVIKHGKTTNLSVGVANKPRSVLRSGGHITEEWCILAVREYPFSRPSDSGSVVWDTQRRIGGMIIAGCGFGSNDVTYVTPMERLLKDIRRRGYHVELPPSFDEL